MEVGQLAEGLSQGFLIFISLRENNHHRLPTSIAVVPLRENLPEKLVLGCQLQSAPCGGELRLGVDLDIVELLHGGIETDVRLKTKKILIVSSNL